jgi:pectin methylesterase-like acyl-CoA thioesterase
VKLQSTRRLILAALCAGCAIACGAGGDDDATGSGGMSATGGAQAQSGAGAATGGRPATGGASAVSSTGGSSASGGTGGGGVQPPGDAGPMINTDAGAMSDAGQDASTGMPEPQDLPDALRQAGVLALYPAPNAEQVCPDPSLHMAFSAAPALGASGKVQVFDAAQPGTAVATLDMAKAMTTVSVDGTTYNVPRTAYVDGKEVALYLPAHALKYGHEYFVHVDAGVIAGANGSISITDDTTWRFRTAAAAPNNLSTLRVALDGTEDFCSIQGAIDATSGQSTIAIARGTYHEIVHFRAKDGMTLSGADRKATIIAGTNNENLNGGTAKRALVGVDASSDVVFENLTIHNVTPQDGSQAEALRMQTCDKCIVRNADIISLQDTLLWSGRIYARDCYIAGNVDFIWGTGAAYFDHCEIKTLGRKGYNVQARNGASGYGYVFVDSRLTSDPGITGNLLGRVDAGVYPASHVAYIDCEMGSHIAPVGWQVTGGGTSGLRFWEYQSKSPAGTPIDVSQRLAGVAKQLSSQEAATMRDKSVVLGGWSPQ